MTLRYLKHFLLTATSWALESNDDVLVGGQAVMEGVMMRSPKGYAVAVRRPDGSMRVIKESLQTAAEKWKIFKLPVFRGVGVLGQALALGIKALRFSAEEAIQEEVSKTQAPVDSKSTEPEKVSSWLIIGAMIPALAVNIGLLIALPLVLTNVMQNRLGFESQLLFNTIDGIFRVGIFVLFLTMISWMKDMRRVFEFHGAEHKTVYNFEARESLTIENASKYSTLHPRCGTSFLFVLMIVSIIVFSVVSFHGFVAKLIARIVLLPLIAGLSYEIIRYSAKRPGRLLKLVTYPGLMLQKITTKEPDKDQLATAIKALEEALSV